MAIAHAKQRSTFGAPLSQRQAIQWMLADAEVELRACRWLIWEGAWKADRGEDARVEASIAKLYSSEVLGPRHRRGGADPRRLRGVEGVSAGALVPRGARAPHRRGPVRGAPDGHRAVALPLDPRSPPWRRSTSSYRRFPRGGGAARRGPHLPQAGAGPVPARGARALLGRLQPRLLAPHGRARLDRHDVAEEVRRPRAHRARALRGARGDAGRGRAGERALGGRPPERPAAPALRHRGAAPALSSANLSR